MPIRGQALVRTCSKVRMKHCIQRHNAGRLSPAPALVPAPLRRLTCHLQLLLALGGRQRLHGRAAKLAALGLGGDVAAPET